MSEMKLGHDISVMSWPACAVVAVNFLLICDVCTIMIRTIQGDGGEIGMTNHQHPRIMNMMVTLTLNWTVVKIGCDLLPPTAAMMY